MFAKRCHKCHVSEFQTTLCKFSIGVAAYRRVGGRIKYNCFICPECVTRQLTIRLPTQHIHLANYTNQQRADFLVCLANPSRLALN